MHILKRSYTDNNIEAGCDEAGRGCLAGPVFAAAVILPHNFNCPELDDSKKLSEMVRKDLCIQIHDEAVAWGVASVSPEEIDEINILNASLLAMHRAIDKLATEPELLLIDGNRFIRYHDIPHHCIVKGDSKFMSIAAASILAKTHRDAYMEELGEEFPEYDWASNKGYPTPAHKRAIFQYGRTEHHRMTFRV